MGVRTHTPDPKTGNLYTITSGFGPVPKTPPANLPENAPAWMRRMPPPIIPHLFQILMIGKGELFASILKHGLADSSGDLVALFHL